MLNKIVFEYTKKTFAIIFIKYNIIIKEEILNEKN